MIEKEFSFAGHILWQVWEIKKILYSFTAGEIYTNEVTWINKFIFIFISIFK